MASCLCGITIRIGQIIAVALENNYVYLTSAHTGKVIHQIDCTAQSKSAICCLGWGINLVDAEKLQIPRDKLGRKTSLDGLFSPDASGTTSDDHPDLPRDLAFLDVEALLPRLSSLTSGGVE